MGDRITHEYVGFHYDMLIENGVAVAAFPLIGQHKAAGKEKHRRAAIETYNQQHPPKKRLDG